MTGTARREEGAPVAATFADPRLIVLGENKMVGHAIHGMIALGGRSRRGSRVTPTPDSTLADAQQTIADLRRELAESEPQKAAMAEVLGVINSSPGELSPVFDAILEKAHTLCGASHGVLAGEHFRAVATHELPTPFAELLRRPFPPEPGGPQEQLLRGERLFHAPDASVLTGPGVLGQADRTAGKFRGAGDALRVNDSRKTQAATKMRTIKCPHRIFRRDYLVIGRDRISARPTTYLTENCCGRDAACASLCEPATGCGAGETAETTAA